MEEAPAPVESGDEKPPQRETDTDSGEGSEPESVEEYPVNEPHPESEHYSRIMQCLGSQLSDSDIWGSDDDEELFRKDAASLARGALDYYNNKEGVKYVLDDGGITAPINFHGALLYHLNFTANKEDDQDTPSRRNRFFAEIVVKYGSGRRVLHCIKMDTLAPELVRKGCIYCPEHVEHPPVEKCEYGTNGKEDEEKLEGPGT